MLVPESSRLGSRITKEQLQGANRQKCELGIGRETKRPTVQPVDELLDELSAALPRVTACLHLWTPDLSSYTIDCMFFRQMST